MWLFVACIPILFSSLIKFDSQFKVHLPAIKPSVHQRNMLDRIMDGTTKQYTMYFKLARKQPPQISECLHAVGA